MNTIATQTLRRQDKIQIDVQPVLDSIDRRIGILRTELDLLPTGAEVAILNKTQAWLILKSVRDVIMRAQNRR